MCSARRCCGAICRSCSHSITHEVLQRWRWCNTTMWCVSERVGCSITSTRTTSCVCISRTVECRDQNAQIENELLAIVFASDKSLRCIYAHTWQFRVTTNQSGTFFRYLSIMDQLDAGMLMKLQKYDIRMKKRKCIYSGHFESSIFAEWVSVCISCNNKWSEFCGESCYEC